MSYISEDFLLNGETAKKLYAAAKEQPIFDYHCHLPEKQILENAPFSDVYEIWLKGDHYKWRLMRNFGVDERYITGDATNEEKFTAYCRTLGTAFGNPLYHWSQAELEQYFGCTLEINEKNAPEIWKRCNDYIRSHAVTPQSLIEGSNVTHLFTTNEIFDDLTTFEKIAKKGYKFKVAPAFRADRIMNIDAADYLSQLAKLGKVESLGDLENKISSRLAEFKKVGARAADIAVERVYPVAERSEAAAALQKRLGGGTLTVEESEAFKGYLTYFLFKLYARSGIVTELHVGAMRNNNAVQFAALGPDTGYDSISDANSITAMSRLFDRLNSENALPRTIVFNLNPKMNSEIMSLIGCFQSSEAKGKMQYGAAWWFLDNKAGMEKHLLDLTATGHIGAFVGMLTDSRSLLSYPRHLYFRRILCSFLGGMMDRGEMTRDLDLVTEVVRDISYRNAIEYFGL